MNEHMIDSKFKAMDAQFQNAKTFSKIIDPLATGNKLI